MIYQLADQSWKYWHIYLYDCIHWYIMCLYRRGNKCYQGEANLFFQHTTIKARITTLQKAQSKTKADYKTKADDTKESHEDPSNTMLKATVKTKVWSFAPKGAQHCFWTQIFCCCSTCEVHSGAEGLISRSLTYRWEVKSKILSDISSQRKDLSPADRIYRGRTPSLHTARL